MTSTFTTLTISRRDLIDLAFEAIEGYEDRVSDENRKHLLYAACTIDQVALGDWIVDEKCGCLVGSAYLAAVPASEVNSHWDPHEDIVADDIVDAHVLTQDEDEATALYSLGCVFDDLLRANLDETYGERAVYGASNRIGVEG